MKKVTFFVGVAAALLGGLWLLQGLAIVQMRPILCFADCVPIQGASTMWAVIGVAMLTAGGAAIFWSLRSR